MGRAVTTTRRANIALVAIVAALWSSDVAQAAMPPGVYEAMLADAGIHLQLAVTGRGPAPRQGFGACRVTGIVVHAFRGPVEMGAQLAVTVPCMADDAGDVPVGGAVFTPVSVLRAANFLELALVEGPDGSHAVAADGTGVAVIDAPSRTPVLAVAAAADRPPDVTDGGFACVDGAPVEVSSWGYWEKEATVRGGPDARGRCLVQVGQTDPQWFTAHRLREPGSDKPLPALSMMPSGSATVPDGAYLCYAGGAVGVESASFLVQGEAYLPLSGTGGGSLAVADGAVSWNGGIFDGLDAVLQQEVDSGETVVTFPPEVIAGTDLEQAGNNLHCFLQDGL